MTTCIGRIIDRYRLSGADSSKEVWHLTLRVSGGAFSYRPGDSVGIWPKQSDELVRQLLAYFRADPDLAVTDPKTGLPITAYACLQERVELGTATPKLLACIAHSAHTRTDKRKAEAFLSSAPSLADYDVLGLLQEYAPSGAPIQEVLEGLLPSRPRLYSIASAPSLSRDSFDLTIARVCFQKGARHCFGACSNYLLHWAAPRDEPICFFVQQASHFSLPLAPPGPVIMVGPGTGVAPFRAYVQELEVAGCAWPRCWLFFGGRNRATDFLYEGFWQSQVDSERIRLDVAFSRDQAHKVYVQHRMWDYRAELWRWFEEGAVLCVCGDAKTMAKDVDSCVTQIAATEGHMSEAEATAWIRDLRRQKRYLRDIYGM